MGPYLIKMLHLQAQTILPTAPSACLVEGTRQDLFPVAQELGAADSVSHISNRSDGPRANSQTSLVWTKEKVNPHT